MSAKPAPKKKTTVKPSSEFSTAEKIMQVITPMQNVERLRAYDRATIDNLFNGEPPYTKEEEEKFQIEINVNWGEGKRIMGDANNQLNSALLHPGLLFSATCRAGAVDKRDEWAMEFAQNMHIPLQEGKSGFLFSFLIRNRNATIAMHGLGPVLWANDFKWIPRFIPLEDLLIPSQTSCDYSNLRYFAVNLYLTPGELIEMTHGDTVLPGWNMTIVRQVLQEVKDQPTGGNQATWIDRPEEMVNVFKENCGWYYSDSVPRIRARYFFYKSMETGKWHRMMLLREAGEGGQPSSVDTKQFLFDGSKAPVADDINHILSIQYGDKNFVAPLKIHAVRGLGVDLYAPVETNNRLRCEFVQSVFEHLKMYFRIQNPADRDRLKEIVLQQYGVLPQGLEVLKREERHQIDPALVADAMGQMRQIMQESSSSFVQNVNDGTQKEMTAKEANIRLNQATMMVSAMIGAIYFQENFFYEEIKRRFCKKGSADPDVKAFQKRCIEAGIPEDILLKHENWKLTVERVLGGGDKTLAQEEGAFLWNNSNQFEPSVQGQVKRTALAAILGNYDKARQFIPITPVTSTSGTQLAEQLFGTLMTGNPCAVRNGIDIQGYVQTLLRMMGGVVQRIQSTDNMGTAEELGGLITVAQNIGQYLQILGQDPKNKQMLKQIGDTLGKLMNEVKGFGQRLQEKHQNASLRENLIINYKDAPEDVRRQMEQTAGFTPSQMPQPDPKAAKAEQQMQIKNEQHAQKSTQSAQSFQLEQERRNAEVQAAIARENTVTRHKLLNDRINTVATGLAKIHQAKNSSGHAE